MEKKDMTAVITRCLRGESLAQEELVLAVQDRVYYHCRKMLKDEDRAFDLTQDVLMAMLTKLDTLQNPEAFWSWLGGITANLCRNAINRGPREMQIPEDEEGNSLLDTYETLDEQTVPDKALDNDETRRMIAELVDELPDAQRQCVLLYYYDEMSVKDIAASLDVSENTIKSRLNYARKSIKEGVERYEKQGIKLYSLSPLPFLLFFLGRDAKACSMTAEQATQLAQQVVQGTSAAAAGAGTVAAATSATTGGSAAGVVSGSAAATTAKAAATVAGKGLLGGLSTKMIAGVAAGLILAGGITGGVLLGGEKDTGNTGADTDQIPVSTDEQISGDEELIEQDDGWISMAYVTLPEWANEPFDQVGKYFGENCTAEVAKAIRNPFEEDFVYSCYYYDLGGENIFSTRAELDDDRITYAQTYYRDTAKPVGWLDIFMGDSYESVMAKLGLQDISPEYNKIVCSFYENDPDKSEYIAHTQTQTGRTVTLNYYHTAGMTDSLATVDLLFIDEQLDTFQYFGHSSGGSHPETEEDDQSDGDSGGGMVISNISDITIELDSREQVYDDGFIGGGEAYTTTIDYIELPEWIGAPYAELGRYFLIDPHFSEYQPRIILWDDVPKFCEWRPPEDTMCRLQSPLDIEFVDGSDEFLTLTVRNLTYEEIPISVGWLDTFTGDSFECVLDKLGLHDLPINTERVEARFNQSGPTEGRCSYYTTSDDTAAPPYQEITLYYGDTPVCFIFSEGKLYIFTYGYYPV